MGCPRCGGPLSEFTLGDSRSATCEDCGWVGVDIDLGRGTADDPAVEWGDVTGPGGTESGGSEVAQPGARPAADEGAIPHETRTLLGLEADEADRLEAAGIRSLDALAAADPDQLADELGIAAHRIRPWVRRASILLVTDGAEGAG